MYTFLIWTPILIVFSWVLEILVDTPSKNFAYLLDIQTRTNRPPPPKKEKKEIMEGEMDNMEEPEQESEEEYYSFGNFLKRAWPIIGFAIWLFLVFAVTQIYIYKKVNEGGDEFIDPKYGNTTDS